MRHVTQKAAVVVRDTGDIAYTDEGAAIAPTLERAVSDREFVADFMGWDIDRLAIYRLLFIPVDEAALGAMLRDDEEEGATIGTQTDFTTFESDQS